jgi:hypothetical protein
VPRWLLADGGVIDAGGVAHRLECDEAPAGGEAVSVPAGRLFTRDVAPKECGRCEPGLEMRLGFGDEETLAL